MRDLLTPFKDNKNSTEEISMPSQVGNWIRLTRPSQSLDRVSARSSSRCTARLGRYFASLEQMKGTLQQSMARLLRFAKMMIVSTLQYDDVQPSAICADYSTLLSPCGSS